MRVRWVVVACVGFVVMFVPMRDRRQSRSAAEESDGLHFVVVRPDRVGWRVFRERQRTVVAIAEQLRVDAEYERWVDGLSRAADLGRVVVQRVEVLQDVVERALGDVFPFILIGRGVRAWVCESVCGGERDGR